ncbi:MAG TPA: hypothetical protein PKE45_03555, partial [Caldilineaceae bacterium]|nr:hypothetical protein [Caldilineaceae bacterium]
MTANEQRPAPSAYMRERARDPLVYPLFGAFSGLNDEGYTFSNGLLALDQGEIQLVIGGARLL